MKGFFVKVIEKDVVKDFKIGSPIVTLGNDYRSSIFVESLKKSIDIAEHRENSIKINFIEGLEFKIHYNNKVFDVDEIRGLFPNSNSLEFSKNVICEIVIDNKRVFLKASELKKDKTQSINKFKKNYISKENISFVTLFLTLSIILLTFLTYASINVKPLPQITKLEERDKEIEIDYRLTEKGFEEKKDQKVEKTGKEKANVIEKRETKETPKVDSGTFFEGQAVIKEGVLGVREGAKTVLIQKERSLFSKIDETLEAIPVKGSGEASDRARKIDSDDIDKYQSVKAENIYKGPEKKDIKVELSTGASIKATTQKESDIRILKGKRPENEILSVMARYKKGFEFIFIDARKKDPQLEGKVVVFFVISEEGQVTKAEVVESSIKNQEFLDRIITLVKSIRFPQSDTGDTGVKIPLLFFPQG